MQEWEDSVLSKMIYRSVHFQPKSSRFSFYGTWKTDSKVYLKSKSLRILRILLNKRIKCEACPKSFNKAGMVKTVVLAQG